MQHKNNTTQRAVGSVWITGEEQGAQLYFRGPETNWKNRQIINIIQLRSFKVHKIKNLIKTVVIWMRLLCMINSAESVCEQHVSVAVDAAGAGLNWSLIYMDITWIWDDSWERIEEKVLIRKSLFSFWTLSLNLWSLLWYWSIWMKLCQTRRHRPLTPKRLF